jgi:hypothetical protein
MSDAPTQPLPRLNGPGGVLAAQLARFGQLAGRDLSARASAAPRAGRARDLPRRGEERACPPLTPAEKQEMTALRAAITSARRPGDPGGGTAEGQPGHGRPPQLPRLRRRPAPVPVSSAGRHHRSVGAGPGHPPVRRA